MLPDTLLTLGLFLASIGPGYVHIRVAEQRAPRIERTPLAELAEFVVIGAAATVSAGGLLLLVSEVFGWLDAGQLLTDTEQYFDDEPGRVLAFLMATLIVSYAAAVVSAHVLYTDSRLLQDGQRTGFAAGSTSWSRAMYSNRPDKNAVVMVRVELRDGRQVVGVVGSFTAGDHDDRELVLAAPLGFQRKPGGLLEPLPDEAFMLLRESQIVSITGRYIPGAPTTAAEGPTG